MREPAVYVTDTEKKMDECIKLLHGDGGRFTTELINEIFCKYIIKQEYTKKDSFVFEAKSKYAFTTDSFIVKPIFFNGGDIGKLSVCGTINDLITAGATPLYLSASFIIEEGFYVSNLEKIVKSMAKICSDTGTVIVTGDTKVVEKGKADGIFINTSGIGKVSPYFSNKKILPEDEIILTGGIGEHGTAILTERYDIDIEKDVTSDCAPLNCLTAALNKDLKHIKLMKDPTRGGLATALNEITANENCGIEITESSIPLSPKIKAVNDILGTDPLYLACEGRMIIIAERGYGNIVLSKLKRLNVCKNVALIGKIIKKDNLVYLNTPLGGKRILFSLESSMLPRIC